MTNTAAQTIIFEPTTVGVNADFNVIHWATGVQIFSGWACKSPEWYWIAVPATARNSGVRAVEGFATKDEAYAAAEKLVQVAAKTMGRRHAEALRMDRARPVNQVTDAATRTDEDALRDTQNHHQGSRVHAADVDHGRQLRRAGLTGKRGGLTRRGSIVAERLRNQALDDAFGPL